MHDNKEDNIVHFTVIV